MKRMRFGATVEYDSDKLTDYLRLTGPKPVSYTPDREE